MYNAKNMCAYQDRQSGKHLNGDIVPQKAMKQGKPNTGARHLISQMLAANNSYTQGEPHVNFLESKAVKGSRTPSDLNASSSHNELDHKVQPSIRFTEKAKYAGIPLLKSLSSAKDLCTTEKKEHGIPVSTGKTNSESNCHAFAEVEKNISKNTQIFKTLPRRQIAIPICQSDIINIPPLPSQKKCSTSNDKHALLKSLSPIQKTMSRSDERLVLANATPPPKARKFSLRNPIYPNDDAQCLTFDDFRSEKNDSLFDTKDRNLEYSSPVHDSGKNSCPDLSDVCSLRANYQSPSTPQKRPPEFSIPESPGNFAYV